MISALLLAAGASTRFGSNKLTERLADGTPMVVRSAQNLLAAGCRVVAVTRPRDQAAGDLLAAVPGVVVSACPTAELGMGCSLAWGVAQTAGAAGWLIALGDMPFIRPTSIRAVLLAVERGASIAAPVFKARRGHPVVFARCWRERLLGLDGETGGRLLLQRYADAVTLVSCDDSGVLRDVDRPRDLSF
jgi:molybdenum cofactor cytidylyltransferase